MSRSRTARRNTPDAICQALLHQCRLESRAVLPAPLQDLLGDTTGEVALADQNHAQARTLSGCLDERADQYSDPLAPLNGPDEHDEGSVTAQFH